MHEKLTSCHIVPKAVRSEPSLRSSVLKIDVHAENAHPIGRTIYIYHALCSNSRTLTAPHQYRTMPGVHSRLCSKPALVYIPTEAERASFSVSTCRVRARGGLNGAQHET